MEQIKLYSHGTEVGEIDRETFEIAKMMLNVGQTLLAVVEELMQSKTYNGLKITSALAVRIALNAKTHLAREALIN